MIYLLPFGSQVYGLTTEYSDKDYVALVIDEDKPEYIDTGFGIESVEIVTKQEFQLELNKHNIKFIEVYLTNSVLLLNLGITFVLNKSSLRRSVSKVVSNAHVKSRKKIRDGYLYLGLKSYWHCIRILTCVIKYLEYKPNPFYVKDDFELVNIYNDIMIHLNTNKPENVFNILDTKYKKHLNELHTKFRELAPKAEV